MNTNLVHHFKSFLPLGSFNRAAKLFLLATIIDGIIYSAWSLFFNFFILSRGYEKDFLGLVNSLPSIAALLFGIPLGLLSDRIGRRRAMLLGLLVNTLAMGLQVMARQPTLLLAAIFIGGVGGNLYFISQAPFMMSASNDSNRAILFSLNFGLTTLAGAVGSLFAGQLPAWFGGILHIPADSATAYQAVLLCSVALGSLCLLPIFLIKETPVSRVDSPRVRQPVLHMLFNSILWKLVIPQVCIGLGAAILMPYMNVFFAERFHLSDKSLGVLFSLSALLTGIGCVLGPRIAVRLKSKVRTVVLTQGFSLLFLMLLGFTPMGWLAGLSFLARGTFMNMAVPLFSAFSMERFSPQDQGTANSVLNISWTAGWAIGPYLSGLVQQRYGFTPLFIATTFLYALAIGLTWFFFHHAERPQFTHSMSLNLGLDEPELQNSGT